VWIFIFSNSSGVRLRAIDDVFGNGQLPNVVEQRRGAQGFDFALGEAQFFPTSTAIRAPL